MTPDKPLRVFIGSSSEANELSIALAALMDKSADLDVHHWSTAINPGDTTIEGLEAELLNSDFAVLVATADDITTKRAHPSRTPRDNVIFEFGLFVGALGRRRAFLLVPDDFEIGLPSDLHGLSYETWSKKRHAEPRTAVLGASASLTRRMLEIGALFRPTDSQIVRLVSRSELGGTVKGFADRLEDAQYTVDISGNDCKTVVEAGSVAIEKALVRGVSVRIICADPMSPSVPEMLSKMDPRFPTPESFIRSMESVHYQLEDFRTRFPDGFEYRYLPVLPTFGLFLVDPLTDNGFVKLEAYAPKPWLPIGSRPHLVLPSREVGWRENLKQYFENFWTMSRRPWIDAP